MFDELSLEEIDGILNDKWCWSCKSNKDRSLFHKSSSSKDGIAPICIGCEKAKYRKRKYGLSMEEIERLKIQQDYKCLVCGEQKKLEIDHDHNCCSGDVTCGQCVRGLLCHRCNVGISYIEEFGFVEKAMTYLKEFESNQDYTQKERHG
jgi:hypothetical protein